MTKKVKLATGGFLLLFAGAVAYLTLGLDQYECEVCITFQGHTMCRAAAGTTRAEAIRTGARNACAFLASGREQSMACESTPPTSIRWHKEGK